MPSKFIVKFSLVSLLALVFVLPDQVWAAPAASESAGSVIAARRDAWAERGKIKPLLFSKSPVFSGDRLNTNPAGRLQVLFNDDSVLMLAPDTQATITEYVYSGTGEGDTFNVNLARGVTQLISGRMVESQPGSMRVETPEITVGIQGTKVGVESSNGISKVMQLHGSYDKPTLVICGEMQKKFELKENGTVLIMNAESQCVPEIRKMTDDEYMFMQQLAIGLSGPRVEAGTMVAETPPAAPAQILAQAPPVLNNVDNAVHPPMSNISTSQDFSGAYSGKISGSLMAMNMSGVFEMHVAKMTTGPVVDGFNMQAFTTNEANYISAQLFSASPLDSNGNFSLSPYIDVLYTDTGNGILPPSAPQLDVTGGIIGDNVGFKWQVTDNYSPSDFPGMSGSGSGKKD